MLSDIQLSILRRCDSIIYAGPQVAGIIKDLEELGMIYATPESNGVKYLQTDVGKVTVKLMQDVKLKR